MYICLLSVDISEQNMYKVYIYITCSCSPSDIKVKPAVPDRITVQDLVRCGECGVGCLLETIHFLNVICS